MAERRYRAADVRPQGRKRTEFVTLRQQSCDYYRGYRIGFPNGWLDAMRRPIYTQLVFPRTAPATWLGLGQIPQLPQAGQLPALQLNQMDPWPASLTQNDTVQQLGSLTKRLDPRTSGIYFTKCLGGGGRGTAALFESRAPQGNARRFFVVKCAHFTPTRPRRRALWELKQERILTEVGRTASREHTSS